MKSDGAWMCETVWLIVPFLRLILNSNKKKKLTFTKKKMSNQQQQPQQNTQHRCTPIHFLEPNALVDYLNRFKVPSSFAEIIRNNGHTGSQFMRDDYITNFVMPNAQHLTPGDQNELVSWYSIVQKTAAANAARAETRRRNRERKKAAASITTGPSPAAEKNRGINTDPVGAFQQHVEKRHNNNKGDETTGRPSADLSDVQLSSVSASSESHEDANLCPKQDNEGPTPMHSDGFVRGAALEPSFTRHESNQKRQAQDAQLAGQDSDFEKLSQLGEMLPDDCVDAIVCATLVRAQVRIPQQLFILGCQLISYLTQETRNAEVIRHMQQVGNRAAAATHVVALVIAHAHFFVLVVDRTKPQGQQAEVFDSRGKTDRKGVAPSDMMRQLLKLFGVEQSLINVNVSEASGASGRQHAPL